MAADVEKLLGDWLFDYLSVRCVTELPRAFETDLPIIRLGRSGGDDVLPTVERPFVDVDCFAANRPAAFLLARRAHDALLMALPGYLSAAGAVVARVDTISGPSWMPWDNTDVRRVGASYQLIVKSPALLTP